MIFEFSDFVADSKKFTLEGVEGPIAIQPRTLSILLLLLKAGGRLVTRDEIIEKVWDGQIVTEGAITTQIKILRQLLDDLEKPYRIVETVYGRGLRLACEVEGRTSSNPSWAEPRQAIQAPDNIHKGTKPTIAILPFACDLADPEAQTVATALPDEILLALSQMRSLHVIARGSSFKYASRPLDLAGIRSHLGVRYCLAGELTHESGKLVVHIDLVDVEDEITVRSFDHRFDLDEVADLRGDLVFDIISEIESAVPENEARRINILAPAHLTAWQAYHLGLAGLYRSGWDTMLKSARYFEQATAIDPLFSRAHAGLSNVLWWQILQQRLKSDHDTRRQMTERAERSVECDTLDPYASLALGRARAMMGDVDEGLEWLDRSVNLCPSNAWGYNQSAIFRSFHKPALAIEHAQEALSLSPQDPLRHSMCAALSNAYFHLGDMETAAEWGRRAQEPAHNNLQTMLTGMATNYLAGYHDEARLIADRVRKLRPNLTIEGQIAANPMMTPEAVRRLKEVLLAMGFD